MASVLLSHEYVLYELSALITSQTTFETVRILYVIWGQRLAARLTSQPAARHR